MFYEAKPHLKEIAMLLRFPFLYAARPPVVGGAPAREVVMGDWAETEIRDVTAADMPVVAEWSAVSAAGTPYGVEVRSLEGHFYRPRTSRNMAWYMPAVDGVVAQTADNLLPTRPLYASFMFQNHNDPHIIDTYEEVRGVADRTAGQRVRDSDLEERLAHHLANAEGLVVVDGGEIWERCAAPELQIDFFFTPPKAEIVFRTERERGSPAFEKAIIPLSEAEVSAPALLQVMSDPRLLANSDAAVVWTPEEVVLPQVRMSEGVMSVALALRYTLERANVFLEGCSQKYDFGLDRWPTAFVREWLEFKDAIAAAETSPSDERIGSLFAQWDNTNEALEQAMEARIGAGLLMRHFGRLLERSKVEAKTAVDYLTANNPAPVQELPAPGL